MEESGLQEGIEHSIHLMYLNKKTEHCLSRLNDGFRITFIFFGLMLLSSISLVFLMPRRKEEIGIRHLQLRRFKKNEEGGG